MKKALALLACAIDTDAAGKPTGIRIHTLIFGDEKHA